MTNAFSLPGFGLDLERPTPPLASAWLPRIIMCRHFVSAHGRTITGAVAQVVGLSCPRSSVDIEQHGVSVHGTLLGSSVWLASSARAEPDEVSSLSTF